MNAGRILTGHLIVLMLLTCRGFAAEPDAGATGTDDSLAAARSMVDKSDKYMHHSRLKRGMKGYGLTVLAGTEPVKFQAEIVSVVSQWGPGQEIILARLTGQNLEKTGVISGMSGSPVYVTDPVDGKDKMIGAVAYGWRAQKEALCGIQPITQMLAIPGVLPRKTATTAPATANKAPSTRGGAADEAFIKAILNPKKIDFSTLAQPTRTANQTLPMVGGGQLAPLATPLMISGGSERLMTALRERFASAGIMPVQAGGVVKGVKLPPAGKLVPGSAVSIPMVAGDIDWSATGTVTEVIGDRVLAFGHGFYSEGQVRFPMGPAYVHTVVSGVLNSFKLSSTMGRTGVLEHDSHVGISGRMGQDQKVSMIPMTVSIDWKIDGRKQVYRYQIVRDRWLTPVMVSMLIRESAWAWRKLPEYHTVRHSVDMNFEKLGKYHAENVSSSDDVMGAASDATRPIVAMLNNSLGIAPELRSVDVKITIEAGDTRAIIKDFKLDGKAYRPGETVTGTMVIRAFKRKHEKIPLSFQLPEDLPEGSYTLTVCEADAAIRFAISEMPQRFNPRSVEELFTSVKEMVKPRASNVYLRLPLNEGGVALGQKELPDLPESRTRIIEEADQFDTESFTKTLVRSAPTPYVLSGSAEASFTVEAHPKEIRLKK